MFEWFCDRCRHVVAPCGCAASELLGPHCMDREATSIQWLPGEVIELIHARDRVIERGRRGGWGEHLSKKALAAVRAERHKEDWLPPRCYSVWGIVAALNKAIRRLESEIKE